jgi:hypothetical protein
MTPTPAIEPRRDVRLSAEEDPGYVRLFAPIKVLDFGEAGMMVETDGWLPPESRLPVCLEPGIRMTGVVTSCALVRIHWTSYVPRTIYQVALRLDPPPAESRAKLLELLRSLARLAPADPLPTALMIG